ncbi:hypothetical protein [Hyalangium versicolor]|uniref:hypothetical protein n=1 Tax=Hyalangium versicolor TaxID=2861190 RepID=UPI001CCD14BA|nr:hypothetical protein [Hyalangium versicolor]
MAPARQEHHPRLQGRHDRSVNHGGLRSPGSSGPPEPSSPGVQDGSAEVLQEVKTYADQNKLYWA